MNRPPAPREPRDRAVRDRLRRELDTGFAVGAGAGSGKTRVLVERIVGLVDAGVELDRIVAITFTEKAAAELRDRVRRGLEGPTEEGGGEVAERRRRAREIVDLAPLTTIHGYCRSLLAGRPIEAGVSPGFRTLDALEADLLLEAVGREYLGRLQESDDSRLEGILLAGGRPADLRELVMALRRFPDLEPAPPAEPAEDARAVLTDLIETARAIVAYAEAVPATDTLLAQARAVAETVGAGGNGGDDHDIVLWLEGLAIHKNAGARKRWSADPEAFTALKERWRELSGRRDGVLAAWRDRRFTHLLGYAREVLAEYRRRKDEQGALDFDDLLLKTRDLLRHPAAARSIRRGIDRVLVDEFQDTDPVQVEIILNLVRSPGSLFIVGDANQSIYRFRRADLDVFDRAREQIVTTGEEARLEVCFRSSPGLVAAANRIFSDLLPPEAYADLLPHRTRDPAGAPVALLDLDPILAGLQDDDDRAPSADIVRRAEARALAGWIAAMRERPGTIIDPDTEQARPLRYGDVTVLVRTYTGVPVIEREFDACGLPYRTAGGRAFFQRIEIAQTLPVLRAIADPGDAAAVVAALRSPCFGVSDEDLVRHAASGRGFSYLPWPQEDPDTETPDDLTRAFVILAELHRAAVLLPPSALVRRLFDATRVIPLQALKPDGDRRMANLLKLLDLALAWEEAAAGITAAAGPPGLMGFVTWLEEQRQAAAEEESTLAVEGEDAVVIMTIHAAKGLEFPVVAILDRMYTPTFRDRAIPDRGRGVVYLATSGLQPVGWPERVEEEKQHQADEARRLLYVAFTRARDHVVLCSSRSGSVNEKAFLAPLETALRSAADAAGDGNDAADDADAAGRTDVAVGNGTGDALVQWGESIPLPLRDEPPHRLPRSFSEPAAAEIAAAARRRDRALEEWGSVVARAHRPLMLRASRLNGFGIRYPELTAEDADEGLSEASPPDLRRIWYARLRGTRVHEAMELVAGFGYPADEACRAVSGPGDPEELQPELSTLVDTGVGLLRTVRAEGWQVAGTEWPLLLHAPASVLPESVDGDIEVLTGTADLVLEHPDGTLLVVDYKTGAAPADVLIAHYRAQITAYAALLGRASGRAAGAEIWALSTGERIPVTW